MDPNGTIYLFQDFCGGDIFWEPAKIDRPTPKFSTCLLDTALTWIPCGFLWISLPVYLYFMCKVKNYAPLPLSFLSAFKGVVSFLLSCLVVLHLILQQTYGPECSGRAPGPSGYTATALKFFTMCLSIILQQLQRQRGLKTSPVPFVFWFLVLLSEGLSLYTHVSKETVCVEDIVFYIYFGLIIIQLGNHCFAEEYRQKTYNNLSEKELWAEDNASILSKILYHWFTIVVWKVYKGSFQANRFWAPSPRLQCQKLAPLLEIAWEKEVMKSRQQKITSIDAQFHKHLEKTILTETSPIIRKDIIHEERKHHVHAQPSLFKAVVKVFWWDWTEATIYRIIAEVLWLLEPVALRYIIQIAEDRTSGPEWQGYFFCCMLFVNLCISSCFYHLSYHSVQALGLKVKSALMCLIYRKALTMKRGSNQSSTVGEIVNLMSVDCQRVQDSLTFSFYSVVTVFTFGISLVQLWTLMGIASVGGISIILAMLPVVGYISTLQFKLQKEMLYLKGKRIRLLNEVISGIKVLKMYAWELSFMKKIQGIRQEELNRLLRYAYLSSVTVVFAVHSPFMILFTLILIHVLLSPTHTLKAEEIFTAISIINIIKFPITICPFLVNGAVQAKVSIERICEFLSTDDLETNNVKLLDITSQMKDSSHVLRIQHGDFAWGKDSTTPLLSNICLEVKEGELVAVVGQVGAGKSSLLAACLGEMEKLAGDVFLRGSVAYVPQEAWIQNMSLRDNILFGKSYMEIKYIKVIEACALLPDLSILAGGDMTEIGEKGINISGGQKQRVNLARAVYQNADIYFLDDPLSAVDSHVGKHLFQNVIGNHGLLKHKTRVLVTHGIHWLPMVDRIIVINEGQISETGSYSELVSAGGALASILQSYLQEASDDEDSDPEIANIRQKIQREVGSRSDGGLTSDDGICGISSHIRRKRSMKDGEHSLNKTSKSNTKKTTDSTDKKNDSNSRLTVDEVSAEGAVKPTVLLHFMRAMGMPAVISVVITMTLFQGLNVYSNFWLTFWTENPLLLNTTLAGTDNYEDTFLYYLIGYALQGIFQGVLVFVSFYLALTRMVRASGKLHNSMLEHVLHSPMSFFDTTPVGRIMNRFSSDVDIMDNKLPESFRLWQIMIFSTIAVVAVVIISTPIFIVILLPIVVFYVYFVRFYLPTARQMRRIESVSRSPIYNHFSETISGSSVIRAYKCADRFIEESRNKIDENIKFYYSANCGARWVGWRVELIGNMVAFLAAVVSLVWVDLNGAQVGMSITYAVQLTITLNFGVFAISEMEMNIVAAERVTEYTSLPSEADWTSPRQQPPALWPNQGKIEFRNYKTQYRQGLDLVLKGIRCKINDGGKVGIVGRTGAGKSSMALGLFRLIEAVEGTIIVDGIDIATLGLHDLRKRLTILPQDPVLFSGTLRMNLDPFYEFNDESVWHAIECAHLKDFVVGQRDLLEFECGEAGQNLSVGQRQLICLARALLHKTKILILDEATSAVDLETDDLIQDTIRTQFKECTVLAVAHRLNTVMDYDRVMVLDNGMIVEFDSPIKLLQNPSGMFYGMAKDARII